LKSIELNSHPSDKTNQGHDIIEVNNISDTLAVEEPLEIRVEYGPEDQRLQKSISITMRTPGHDFELAAGFYLPKGF